MSKKVKNKKMFIEELPRKIYNGFNCIDWLNAKGLSVHFVYGDIEDDILIKDIAKGKICTKLLLEYNGNEKWCDSIKLKNCPIGSLLGIYSYNYRYEIGQLFKDKYRNFSIIDKKTEKDNSGISRRYYKYHCNKCGAELWMEESNIKRGSDCACCCNSANKTIVKGITILLLQILVWLNT